MSWAEEDWTVGLSGRVLQKVKELQVHKERLSRENKQKQLQLDNLQISLEKQTVKYEEVRAELQCLQRELQGIREEAKAAAISRDRLTQELHSKQAQVCSLEGQLDAARTLNNKLAQEVKRLEAELENLQNSTRFTDATLFSTPSWNATSPWDHNTSKREDSSGQRDERWNRGRHVRQQLQFSNAPSASPQQPQHKSTPQRHPSHQSETFSTPSAAFPWEQEESRTTSRRRQQHPSPQAPAPVLSPNLPELESCGNKERTNNSAESLSDVESCIAALENELSAKDKSLKSIENEMVQTKQELAAKELNLQRARDELGLAHTRTAQESERVSAAEQKLKQVQEELKCQRQNADSSRLHHQQRTKELEKQHQKDLSELQKERQSSEKQHQQEANRLNQELQQAVKLHNSLQAQVDKLSLQKQASDKELEALKDKLKWTDGELKESQKKETQTQAKLLEATREAEGVAVSLEQSRKRERALEEEGRRLKEEQADTLRLLKELQEQRSAATLTAPQGGQTSFSYSSTAPSPQAPIHKKGRAATSSEQKRDDRDLDHEKGEVLTSHHSAREPGEGIDAEHISPIKTSECERDQKLTSDINKEVNRNEPTTGKSSSVSSPSDLPITSSTNSEGGMDSHSPMPLDRSSCLQPQQTVFSEDLKKENASLRSELRDVREELQRRLEDLETQRRAESEARTRLKQLSRKQASQAVEREEKTKEWKTQLESEKAETERLRRSLAALEAELRKVEKETARTEEEEKQDNTKDTAGDDRESEMIELNIQLKNQLAEVKAQLAVEREERKNEEDQRNQMSTDVNLELAKLKAELEELKHSRQSSQEDSKTSAASSPLTYLTLHGDDELNSNIVDYHDNLPSPEQHRLICRSTNQLNKQMSAAAAADFQEIQRVIEVQSPSLFSDDSTELRQDQERSSSPDFSESDSSSCDLAKEVKRLQREKTKETERADQCQVKLEALQDQVTQQTRHLTMAFEKQSQHITGLLIELQEKENAFLTQGEELKRHKEKLAALKAENCERLTMCPEEEGERDHKEKLDTEHFDIKEEEEKCVVLFEPASPPIGKDLKSPGQTLQPKIEPRESSKVMGSSTNNLCSVSLDLPKSSCGSTFEVSETQDDHEKDAFRSDDHQVKQRSSNTQSTVTETEDETTEQFLGLNSRNAQDTQTVPRLLITEQQPVPKEDKSQGEDGTTVKRNQEPEETSEDKVKLLHQQVEALLRKVRDLTEETHQQAQELAVWRLASQPSSTLDQLLTGAGDESEISKQLNDPTKIQADDWASLITGNATVQTHLKNHEGSITVVREDEVSLCCSSNRLRGRLLFSRLQNVNLPEPKDTTSSDAAQTSQERRRGSAGTDLNSDKENQALQFPASPTKGTEKKNNDLIQMSPQKTSEQEVSIEPRDAPTPAPATAGECCTGKPAANPNPAGRARHFADGDVSAEPKSVGSQTEGTLFPPNTPKVCASTQTEETNAQADEEDSVTHPLPPAPAPEKVQTGDKTVFPGSFPIPADPVQLAERIRRNRTQLSAAFDDTEYEPYGLPEVVMKGFADIPSGPSCPYIVRRGLLGTTVVPVAQKDSQTEEETD